MLLIWERKQYFSLEWLCFVCFFLIFNFVYVVLGGVCALESRYLLRLDHWTPELLWQAVMSHHVAAGKTALSSVKRACSLAVELSPHSLPNIWYVIDYILQSNIIWLRTLSCWNSQFTFVPCLWLVSFIINSTISATMYQNQNQNIY